MAFISSAVYELLIGILFFNKQKIWLFRFITIKPIKQYFLEWRFFPDKLIVRFTLEN